jgi:hypothetical protein
MFTLQQLDTVAAHGVPFRFEYIDKQGKPSGIYFEVYGEESDVVFKRQAKLTTLLRKAKSDAVALAQLDIGVDAEDMNETVLTAQINKLFAACRIASWDGIDAECTEENAKKLCKSNSHIAKQILEKSTALGKSTAV